MDAPSCIMPHIAIGLC